MTSVEKIDAILKERHISRRQLAKMAGIAPSTLQSALSRGRIDNIEMIKKIAKALDVPPGLLTGEDSDFLTDFLVKANISFSDFASIVANEMNTSVDFVWASVLTPNTLTDDYLAKIRTVSNNLAVNLDPDEEKHLAESKRKIGSCLSYKLNKDGIDEAVKRVEELTQIPKYQQTPPQAEDQDGENADDTPQEGD